MIQKLQLPYRLLERFSYKEVGAILLITLVSLSYLPIPAVLGKILKQLQNDEIDFGHLLRHCAILVFIFGLQAMGTLLSRNILITYSKTVIQNYRTRLVELYLTSVGSVKNESISSIQKKLFSDTELADQFFNSLLTKIFPATAISVVVVALMCYLNLILLSCILSLVAITFLIARYFKKRRNSALSHYHEVLAQFNKSLLFVLRFKQLISLQSMIEKEHDAIQNNLDRLKRQGVNMVMGFARATNMQEFSQSTVLVITLLISIWLKSAGEIEIEVIFVFFFVIYVLKKQVMAISNEMQVASEGLFALKRLHILEQDLQDLVPKPNTSTQVKVQVSGRVSFDKVGFKYPSAPPLFEDVTFSLLPRKINLIQGANGVGKSTLMWLLLGYLKPYGGTLLIEGIDSQSLDFNDFRRQIGVVLQDNDLFGGTIKDNLSYGVNTSDKEIERILHTTGLFNWVNQLPLKLETRISDLSGSISGGQKQRIVLSRALLKNPRLMIMDEPTNHLDAEFVKSLCLILQELKVDMTILLISHNGVLEAIADQKIKLHEQRITIS